MKEKWLHSYEKYTKSRNSILEKMNSFESKLMFICSCCERLVGNYTATSNLYDLEKKLHLPIILDLLWKISCGGKLDDEIFHDINLKIKSIASEHENSDFEDDLYCTDQILDAFDSGLYYCIDKNDTNPIAVAELSLNSVWMYLKGVRQSELLKEGVLLQRVSHTEAALILEKVDEWSFDHPWTQREIAKQLYDLKVLSETKNIDFNFGINFRRDALFDGLSNLDYNELGLRQ